MKENRENAGGVKQTNPKNRVNGKKKIDLYAKCEEISQSLLFFFSNRSLAIHEQTSHPLLFDVREDARKKKKKEGRRKEKKTK
jgi:hypothetical protein